jgi:hypothetical protein
LRTDADRLRAASFGAGHLAVALSAAWEPTPPTLAGVMRSECGLPLTYRHAAPGAASEASFDRLAR